MNDFRPRTEINRIDFKNGKCLIIHSPNSSLLILRPEDVGHIDFMPYSDGPSFVERNIGEADTRLSVPHEVMSQIKNMAPTN